MYKVSCELSVSTKEAMGLLYIAALVSFIAAQGSCSLEPAHSSSSVEAPTKFANWSPAHPARYSSGHRGQVVACAPLAILLVAAASWPLQSSARCPIYHKHSRWSQFKVPEATHNMRFEIVDTHIAHEEYLEKYKETFEDKVTFKINGEKYTGSCCLDHQPLHSTSSQNTHSKTQDEQSLSYACLVTYAIQSRWCTSNAPVIDYGGVGDPGVAGYYQRVAPELTPSDSIRLHSGQGLLTWSATVEKVQLETRLVTEKEIERGEQVSANHVLLLQRRSERSSRGVSACAERANRGGQYEAKFPNTFGRHASSSRTLQFICLGRGTTDRAGSEPLSSSRLNVDSAVVCMASRDHDGTGQQGLGR
uniref:Uncharacterized protein n=1 Tax=Timema douglasi TaxID=61478 RepID=A0A7R8VG75_TIMDO|nr:unnamed protein product [Timema douglasi]